MSYQGDERRVAERRLQHYTDMLDAARDLQDAKRYRAMRTAYCNSCAMSHAEFDSEVDTELAAELKAQS